MRSGVFGGKDACQRIGLWLGIERTRQKSSTSLILMILSRAIQGVGVAVLWSASLVGSVQAAAGVPPGKVVDIRCCNCIGGKVEPITISTGAASWEVAVPGSSSYIGASLATVNPGWTATLPGSVWIAPSSSPSSAPAGVYTFRLRLRVPDCVIPGRVVISGRFAADNAGQVLVDGNPIASSGGVINQGFKTAAITSFTHVGLSAGFHELTVNVNNIGGVVGLLMESSITSQCSSATEKG